MNIGALKEFLYNLLSKLPRANRREVQMCLREQTETFLGVLDHTGPNAGQYSLIKYNENEHVMENLYGALFDRYIQARVHHFTGISWDSFYKEHEYWETEEMIERCLKLSNAESSEANRMAEEHSRLQAALAAANSNKR